MKSQAEKLRQAQDCAAQSQTSSIDSKDSSSQIISPVVIPDFVSFRYLPQLNTISNLSNNATAVLGISHSKSPRDASLFLKHVHPDDHYQLLNQIEIALAGCSDLRTTYRWIRPDSKEMRWLHCRAVLTTDIQGRQLFDGIIMDLSEEVRGPLRFFSNYESDHDLLAVLPGLAFSLDHDLRIMRIKRPKEFQTFCFGDFAFRHEKFSVGNLFTECFADQEISASLADACKVLRENVQSSHSQRIFENGRNYKLDLRISPSSPSGADKALSSDSLIICMVCDISSLASLENRLAFLHKAEALRRLSAGVGHHFNNALQSILGQATFISSRAENPELVRQTAETIIESSMKAAELTRQLFQESDSPATTTQEIDLNLLIAEVLMKKSESTAPSLSVSLILNSVPAVYGNRTLLKSVFEELLQNASTACKNQAKPQLLVKTLCTELKDDSVVQLPPGKYIVVSFKDNGCGMDFETRENCLDPFFSTKFDNPDFLVDINQSGLGLPKVYSTIRSIGGSIKIRSSADKGSKIEIYFPAKEKFMHVSANPETTYKAKEDNQKFRVLLIDDDESVALAASAMLQTIGEDCIVARNHVEAISKLKQHINSVKLVFLDAVFPKSDSAALLRKIKKIKPELKVIGFSGADKTETNKLLKAGAIQILRKPVGISEFKEVIKQHLTD